LRQTAFKTVCRTLAAGGIALGVTSCGMLGKHSDDPTVAYVSAEERALLEIPPDLSSNAREALLRLPESGKSKIAHSTLLPSPESVRLVRDGSARWLELDADARELWPSLKDFLTHHGYQIARDEPLLGVIETEWRNVTEESSSGIGGAVADLFSGPADKPRERFRLRVERISDADKTVRLFVTQRRIVPAVVADARGRPTDEGVLIKRPPQSEQETEMLLRLLVFLGVQEQVARGVLTSDEVEQLAARAYLEEKSGELTLVVAETHHRVWPLAGEAIEEIGLDIENTVKSESRYEVLFEGVPPADDTAQATQDAGDNEQQGFFFGLFGDEQKIEQYYQVYVLEEPGKTRITITDATGSSKLPALEKQILQRLHEKLR